jgi:hypothetical protein
MHTPPDSFQENDSWLRYPSKPTKHILYNEKKTSCKQTNEQTCQDSDINVALPALSLSCKASQ